jgi:hypothetical protein
VEREAEKSVLVSLLLLCLMSPCFSGCDRHLFDQDFASCNTDDPHSPSLSLVHFLFVTAIVESVCKL